MRARALTPPDLPLGEIFRRERGRMAAASPCVSTLTNAISRTARLLPLLLPTDMYYVGTRIALQTCGCTLAHRVARSAHRPTHAGVRAWAQAWNPPRGSVASSVRVGDRRGRDTYAAPLSTSRLLSQPSPARPACLSH